MKKIIFLVVVFFIFKTPAYLRILRDSSYVEKTGWLVFLHDHAIWFESYVTKNSTTASFFSNAHKFKNGVVVDHIIETKSFKFVTTCYPIMLLTTIDTTTKKGEYTFPDTIYIVPVKVKISFIKNPDPLDHSKFYFKKGDRKGVLDFWFITTYSVNEMELLREEDKNKLEKLKNK